jgi:IclR family pca regulon transcriptional regulator
MAESSGVGDAAARGPSGQYVQSLARGLSVIRAFDADHPAMTLSDIARSTGLTRATSRRFLLTLVELGYVRTDGRLFALNARVLDLGFSYLSALSLPEIAQPHLEILAASIHESTSASVLDGMDIVYVARVPTRRIMSVRISIGTRFPAYATSMGRVLLAGLPPADLEEHLAALSLEGLTAHTLTSASALVRELHRVRDQGWAIVDRGHQRVDNDLQPQPRVDPRDPASAPAAGCPAHQRGPDCVAPVPGSGRSTVTVRILTGVREGDSFTIETLVRMTNRRNDIDVNFDVTARWVR